MPADELTPEVAACFRALLPLRDLYPTVPDLPHDELAARFVTAGDALREAVEALPQVDPLDGAMVDRLEQLYRVMHALQRRALPAGAPAVFDEALDALDSYIEDQRFAPAALAAHAEVMAELSAQGRGAAPGEPG